MFYDAYVSSLATRYGGTTEDDHDESLVTHGDDATSVMRHGDRVYIVDGADDDHLPDELLDGVSFD